MKAKPLTFPTDSPLPTATYCILGGPHDNLEKTKKSLTEIVKYKNNFELLINPYYLLPNSYSYSQEFRKMYNVETFKTKGLSSFSYSNQTKKMERIEYEIIVSTNSYDRNDWIDMNVFSHVMLVFFTGSILNLTAKFLHDYLEISYYNFYSDLYDYLMKNKKSFLGSLFNKGRCEVENFLKDEYNHINLKVEEVNYKEEYLKVEEYILFKILFNIDKCFDELSDYLSPKFIQVKDLLLDLLNYQKNNLITLDYDFKKGKTFYSKYDWLTYFNEDYYKEKPNLYNNKYEIISKHNKHGNSLTWSNLSNYDHQLKHFLNNIIGKRHTRSQKTIFKDIIKT